MNRIQEILVAERLGEEFHGPRLHGPYRHRNVAVRGDENDRNLNIGCGQLALEVQPTDSRQPDIADEATEQVWKLACQEFPGGPEQFDLQTHGFDKALDRAPHRRIVIDNEDYGLGLAHEAPAPSVGRMNSNTAPRELGTVRRRPPWDSIMDRLIDNPSPIPVCLVVKNGSKIRSVCFGSSPIPES